jgi:hypothetical protein
MALIIDSSRAFRSPKELADLIQAVLMASPNDEATWIEWKTSLALADKEVRVNLARHILGMANRPVEEAAQHAEGCGYIVIGAEPGLCGGVTEIDPANLDAGLRSYLGSDGPRWSAQYLKSQGKSVLVITVEPPRRGDRNFTLRKTYNNNQTNYHAGMTFVRRPGRTIPAEPGDISALEDRFLASDHPLTLHMRPARADDSITIRPLANLEQRFEEWAVRRRADLLAKPARANAAPSRLAIVMSEQADKQYEAEVEEYLSECWPYYTQVAISRLLELGELKVPTILVNTSDRNYTDVRIEIYISAPAAMVGNPEDFSPPNPPVVPRRNDKGMSLASVSSGMPISTITNIQGTTYYPAFNPPKLPFTVKTVEDALVVTYDVDRVRPEQRMPLEAFLIFYLTENEGSALEIPWRLTAGNVNGIARGAFNVTIGEPYDSAEILPEFVAEGAL